MKKLSRGQLSAVGVIVGLASRAPLTFFDEPYLGLDAVARQLFYDRLLADYSEHPRTVILSTHLIDEVSNLLEHVIVIDDGRIIIDQDADELRGAATVSRARAQPSTPSSPAAPCCTATAIGGLASATVSELDAAGRAAAAAAGLELGPVSLQTLIVRLTTIRLGIRRLGTLRIRKRGPRVTALTPSPATPVVDTATPRLRCTACSTCAPAPRQPADHDRDALADPDIHLRGEPADLGLIDASTQRPRCVQTPGTASRIQRLVVLHLRLHVDRGDPGVLDHLPLRARLRRDPSATTGWAARSPS